MTDRLTALLADKPVVFADGAMGTSLFALGLATGDCPELWNVDRPEAVASVHRDFVAAGSDIVLTNTFGANARRLLLHGADDRVAALNRAGAAVARGVAEAAGRPVLVAGSMGPTGDLLAPLGPLTEAEAEAIFAEQARALAEGGVDILWVETISAAAEMRAAVAAAAGTGLPVVATFSFDTNGRTMMGLTAAEAVALAGELAVRPVGLGANCGVGPPQLVDTVLELSGAAPDGIAVVAKGNCGIPEYRHGHIHYAGSPSIMADYACLARDAGARIIGGCCGTTAAHVRAMVEAVAARPPGSRPDRAAVEARLGPVAAPSAEAADTPVPGVEERRGRRQRRRA